MLAVQLSSVVQIMDDLGLLSLFPSEKDVVYYAKDPNTNEVYELKNIHYGQYCNVDYDRIYTTIEDVLMSGQDVYFRTDIVNATLEQMCVDLSDLNNKNASTHSLKPIKSLKPVVPKHCVPMLKKLETWYLYGEEIINSLDEKYLSFDKAVDNLLKGKTNKLWLQDYVPKTGYITKSLITKGCLTKTPALKEVIETNFFSRLVECCVSYLANCDLTSEILEIYAYIPETMVELFKQYTTLDLTSMPYAIFVNNTYNDFQEGSHNGVKLLDNISEWLRNGELVSRDKEKIIIRKNGVVHTYLFKKDCYVHTNIVLLWHLRTRLCSLISAQEEELEEIIDSNCSALDVFSTKTPTLGKVIYVEPSQNDIATMAGLKFKASAIFLDAVVLDYIKESTGYSLDEAMVFSQLRSDKVAFRNSDLFFQNIHDEAGKVLFKRVKTELEVINTFKSKLKNEVDFDKRLNTWILSKLLS